MNLCRYKDALGVPGKGIHKYQVFHIAIMDVIFTILAAVVIKILIPTFRFWMILLSLFLLGIILHRLFCVRTTINKILFPIPRK
jgi:hypothetical protein